MGMYLKRAGLPSAPDTIVDSTLLSPQAQVLPDGWSLASGSGASLSYDFAVIGQDGVVLWDSTGKTHEYKFANGGFAPPVGEDGHLVRNGDGTVTLQDMDGRTYVFNTDGTLKYGSLPMDDRNPAALRYVYGGSPAHLTQISDMVTATNTDDPLTATRWAKVLYSGDANCPSIPSGFGSVPANMICDVITSDGNTTQFVYSTSGRLARLMLPGNAITDYGYDVSGRITQIRDALANDAIAAGQRQSTDTTIQTDIAYDALGRVTSVTMPKANVNDASRQAHTYEYQPINGSNAAYTKIHIANAAEPNGFARKVTYDGTFRTTDDTDVANLTSHTDWDSAKDLILDTIDPSGLKSTTLYDYADRPTDQYGPAPSAWFGSLRKPLSAYDSQVPHTQTSYDSSINGLASAYYNVDAYTNGTGSATKVLFGSPKLHATGVGPTSGDVAKTWGGTPPYTPDTAMASPTGVANGRCAPPGSSRTTCWTRSASTPTTAASRLRAGTAGSRNRRPQSPHP
jgi:YD repeat-containing protein